MVRIGNKNNAGPTTYFFLSLLVKNVGNPAMCTYPQDRNESERRGKEGYQQEMHSISRINLEQIQRSKMNCRSTKKLYSDTNAIYLLMVVNGLKRKRTHKILNRQNMRAARSLKWQPLFATKLNSTVLIWCTQT